MNIQLKFVRWQGKEELISDIVSVVFVACGQKKHCTLIYTGSTVAEVLCYEYGPSTTSFRPFDHFVHRLNSPFIYSLYLLRSTEILTFHLKSLPKLLYVLLADIGNVKAWPLSKSGPSKEVVE